MNATFDQAKAYFLTGLDHVQADRLTQAESSFEAALALLPGRVSTLTNLGLVKLKLGKPQQAIELLEQALAQQPDHLETLGHAAAALAELGRKDEALQYVERALQLDATLASAWSLRGSLLRELDRPAEAVASFQNAIHHGADQELTCFYLASLGAAKLPSAPPRHYVESLFDDYAEQFEGHLQALNYRAPQLLVDGLRGRQRRFSSALDLGCGTGLCGALLQGLAARIDGVDLSGRMVTKAQGLGLYRHVAQDDLVHYLKASEQRYDLVLAADVFIYVGALEVVFEAVARRIDAGGLFCFCVEAGDEDQDYALRPSLRYVHSANYLQRLSEVHGFEQLASQRHPVREDQRAPIPGLFVWLQRR